MAEHGGECISCGYSKSVWALSFHHREKSGKEQTIGFLIRDRKLEEAREEAKKCDLLCSNCHAEREEEFFLKH